MNTNQLQFFLDLANQFFTLEQKAQQLDDAIKLQRNLSRIQRMLSERLDAFDPTATGLEIHNPLGEDYDETRTDCSASITGAATENLKIVEVIKPIIRLRQAQMSQIVQTGVVIVKGGEE
ncbi:MAG: hypothetical protein AAGJ82_02835 [Bacteroidota bacterium]